MNTLADKFPDLAKEWDNERNGDLSPDKVTYGSRLTVYWRCPTCGQSYPMRISNRTAPSKQKSSDKCPVCRGQIIIPGYNSLKAKFPAIVEQEWDYDKNDVDPNTIAPHTNKSYYWKCLNGHESYPARVNNKTSNNGGNCPKCSHQKFSPEFSLLKLKPDVANDWDSEKNGGIGADEVSAYSNKFAWWKCSKCGHKWRAKICNRSYGRNCPECAKGHHTSFPEQAIFHFISLVFPDAINGYKEDKMEIDVYIPSYRLGIEYDGEAFHKTTRKVDFDIRKSEKLHSKGIEIIRIRETGCAPIMSDSIRLIDVKYSSNYSDLENVLQTLIDEFCCRFKLDKKITVDFEHIRHQLAAEVSTVPYEASFAAYLAEMEKKGAPQRALWDYENNKPLTPEMVMPFSEKEVAWICPNNKSHRWRNTVKSVSLGYGCPKCSKRPQYDTKGWIQAARDIHGDKYDYCEVVYVNSKTLVNIICPKHGTFQQIPSEHLSGKGCKYCANQAFHPNESLAVISPEIANQWDYERNSSTGYTPETIGINHTIKFWWHCTEGKEHSFQATIAQRVLRKSQCAVCHGKQMAYDRSVEFLFPELAAEWCIDNEKRPSEVSPGSEYKAKWKCPNPNHPAYYAQVYNRAHLHSGCPICAREGHPNKLGEPDK